MKPSVSGVSTDPIQALARHALNADSAHYSDIQRAQARMILLDTLAVGMAGSRASQADALHCAVPGWGAAGPCRVLGGGPTPGRASQLPAASAALVNAYQIHGQEFDCVHEAAVVHPMAAILAAALAEVEQIGNGANSTSKNSTGISGRVFFDAICAAVDVAITVGLSARTGLRFFRPATAGGFGAAAVVCRLRGYSEEQALETFGHMYSQLCGTMQAHTEGKAVLPIQIGFNARNAIVAADLARAGISAPREVISGAFGYLTLFEPDGDIAPALAQLGQATRITELSYKPFPTGRATHGGLDGLLSLRELHQLEPAQIASVKLFGPPLIHRLVARPIYDGLPAHYARLCMQYVGAIALMKGAVGLFDFDAQSLSSSELHALAQRVEVVDDNNPDPNALMPQRVEITLHDGTLVHQDLPVVYGSPEKPMTQEQNLAKVRHCCEFAGVDGARTEALIETGLQLDSLPDIGQWLGFGWQE